MRFTVVVAVLVSLSTVNAYGTRGAAERASLYAMYLLEEVNVPNDGQAVEDVMSIAKGCVGTRTGFRGQAKRCNLLEFCSHVWESTERTYYKEDSSGKLTIQAKVFDGKPPIPDSIKFSRMDPATRDVREFSSIISMVNQKTGKGLPKNNFTGNLKVGNIIEGATDYYDIMHSAAKRAAVAVNAAESETDLSNEARKALGKWRIQATKGLEYAYALRAKEDAMFKFKPPRREADENGKYKAGQKSLEDCFGHPIETRNFDYPGSLKNGDNTLIWDLTDFQEPDMEATIKKNANAFGGEDKARAKYESALNEFYSQETGKEHLRALNSAADAKGAMLGCL